MGDMNLQSFMPLLVRSVVDQEVEKLLLPYKQIKKGDKGDKGDKGKDGKDGYTPQRGIDYFDGLPGKDGYTPVKGVDYFDGMPGRDADLSPATLAAGIKFVFEQSPELLANLKGKDGKDAVTFELAEDVLTFGGEWKQGPHYRKGALVALGGDIWYRDRPGSDGKPGYSMAWKMFLRSGAGRLSGYGVVQGQGGSGGITSLTIGTTPITAGGAGQVLFTDATGAILSGSNNFLYTETSGPRLKVGSGSGANTGLSLGYGFTSGFAAIHPTGVTPDANNYIFLTNAAGSIVWVRASTAARILAPSVYLSPDGSDKILTTNTNGFGLSISAGTATTDVNALSITQNMSAAAVNFTGIKATFTEGASGTGGSTKLLDILYGTSGAEASVASITKAGAFSCASNILVGGSGIRLLASVWLQGVSDGVLSIANSSTANVTQLAVPVSHVLEQRNGTNAQEFRVYNTYTSGTNNELGKLGWTSNVFRVGTVKGSGGGTARALALTTDDIEAFTVDANQIMFPSGTLATNMTKGFINIPGAAGVPSGTPATTTGFPLYWDSTNLQLYVYTGGAWKKSAVFT